MSFLYKKNFKIYKKKSGNLIPFSFKKDLPFRPKRIFLVYGNRGYVRAKHAHFKCSQYIMAISGKVEVSYQTKKKKSKVIINNKIKKGFLSKPFTWLEIKFLTNNCILMIFCDMEYKYSDYIVNYKKFLKLIKSK
tara:strand:- start:698 stop:1102 length:405 start_codon:yes stop_codon:yes gene_type:complete